MKFIKSVCFLITTAALLTGCNENSRIAPENIENRGRIAEKTDDIYSDSGDNFSYEDTDPFIDGFSQIKLSSNLSDKAIGWGLGKNKDSLNRPVDAVEAQKKYDKYSAQFIDLSEKKTVYLTFDEGYENGFTGEILDILKETGVKAAFFVTYDYCKSSPDLVKRMIEEGHIVGNHSYTHPSFPKCSEAQVKEEIIKLHNYVKDNFNYEMSFFRFPMGEFSERTLKQVQDLGYTSVFWSFAYKDWNPDSQPSSQEAFNTITSAMHSGGIYLLHAVSSANTHCLKDVINYWKGEGYSVGDLNKT